MRGSSPVDALSTARRRWAFLVLAAVCIVFLAASSAPTPLYAIYRAELDLTPVGVTAVFAVYPIALLLALLTIGALSDHVGRRPVLLAAIVLEAVAMGLFLVASDLGTLLAARAAQGVATGAATTAVAAGLTDVAGVRGQNANSVAPLIGMASGALVAAAVASSLPAPVPVVFIGLLVLLALVLVATLTLPETAERAPGALASLRIRFGLPAASRGPFLRIVPMLVATWSIGGFTLSLAPSLIASLGPAEGSATILGGLFVCVLTGAGALAIALFLSAAPEDALRRSALALVIGAAMIVIAPLTGALFVLFLGGAVAGFGFGGGFFGALRIVMPTAPPQERARLASSVFTVSYLSMGVPAIGAGILAGVFGIGPATVSVGALVVLLALVVLVGAYRVRRRAHSS